MKEIVMKVVSILCIVGVIVLCGVYTYGTKDTTTITVTEKTVKRYNKEDKYLIFTDTEVYEITDNIFYLQFASSDLYRDLKVGETYEVTVYGWRVPLTSTYRNIVKVQ